MGGSTSGGVIDGGNDDADTDASSSSACTSEACSPNETCTSGNESCACDDTGNWHCAMCPLGAPPANGAACGFANESCDYSDAGPCGVACGCGGDDAGLTWGCTALTCPPPPCGPGLACSPAGNQCTYYPCSDCNSQCCTCTASGTYSCTDGLCTGNDAGGG
jgi:hypothetical protein